MPTTKKAIGPKVDPNDTSGYEPFITDSIRKRALSDFANKRSGPVRRATSVLVLRQRTYTFLAANFGQYYVTIASGGLLMIGCQDLDLTKPVKESSIRRMIQKYDSGCGIPLADKLTTHLCDCKLCVDNGKPMYKNGRALTKGSADALETYLGWLVIKPLILAKYEELREAASTLDSTRS